MMRSYRKKDLLKVKAAGGKPKAVEATERKTKSSTMMARCRSAAQGPEEVREGLPSRDDEEAERRITAGLTDITGPSTSLLELMADGWLKDFYNTRTLTSRSDKMSWKSPGAVPGKPMMHSY